MAYAVTLGVLCFVFFFFPIAHMSCINFKRTITNTLFHWLCMCYITREGDLILAIPT